MDSRKTLAVYTANNYDIDYTDIITYLHTELDNSMHIDVSDFINGYEYADINAAACELYLSVLDDMESYAAYTRSMLTLWDLEDSRLADMELTPLDDNEL